LKDQKREVKVLPPGPVTRKIADEGYDLIFPPPSPYSISVEHASDHIVRDLDGNSYIDFTSGGLESSIGHSNKVVVDKIYEQSRRLLCFDKALSIDVNGIELASQLISALKVKHGAFKVFFGATIEDCVETAARVLKEYSGKRALVTTTHGYYGESSLGMMLSGNVKKRYGSFFIDVFHVPSPYCFRCIFKLDRGSCNIECVDYIENFLFEHVIPKEEIAAILIEPIMVRGGCIIPPEEYFIKLNRLTQKHKLPLITSEAEVGIGRTGSWLASNRLGLKFDALILHNSLANGLPLGALISKTEILSSIKHWHYSRRIQTLSCSVAIEVIKQLSKQGFLENANKQGLYLKKRLNELAEKYNQIGEVRGLGLIAGIEIIKEERKKDYSPDAARKIVRGCMRRGLMISICGKSTLLFAPPLSINSKTIDESLMIFERVLGEKIK